MNCTYGTSQLLLRIFLQTDLCFLQASIAMLAHRLEGLPVCAQLRPWQLSWAQAPHTLGACVAHPHVPAVPSTENTLPGAGDDSKLKQPLL